MGWEGSCRQSSRMEHSHRKEQITRGKNPLANAYGEAQEYSVLLGLSNPSELNSYPFFFCFSLIGSTEKFVSPQKKRKRRKKKKIPGKGSNQIFLTLMPHTNHTKLHLEGSVWQPQGKIQYVLGPAGKPPISQLEIDLILSVRVHLVSCIVFPSMKHFFLSLLLM